MNNSVRFILIVIVLLTVVYQTNGCAKQPTVIERTQSERTDCYANVVASDYDQLHAQLSYIDRIVVSSQIIYNCEYEVTK